jgi:hypothetical protein
MDNVKGIGQGDRVVYAIGGVEYNAIALGTPSEGYNAGTKLKSFHLNLIYLNEQGTPVRIFGAPLLGEVASDEHLKDVAEDALHRDPAWKALPGEARTEQVERKLAHLKANPRTIGWKPFVEGAEVEALKACVEKLKEQLAARGPNVIDASKVDPREWDLDAQRLGNVVPLVNGERVIGFNVNQSTSAAENAGPAEVLPSAEDLDAAVAEQQAAAETGPTEPPAEVPGEHVPAE